MTDFSEFFNYFTEIWTVLGVFVPASDNIINVIRIVKDKKRKEVRKKPTNHPKKK